MTKVSRKIAGKEYEYEYSMIYLKSDTHIRLKQVSQQNKKSFSEMINQMIDQYESNI
jgi:tRNA uridine 5-carbamoylmethylation protein Kti12